MENLIKLLTLIFQNSTRIVSLSIVLLMGAVWAYLSIKTQMMQPVSDNFLFIGGMLIAGEVGAGLDAVGRLNKKIDGGKANAANSA